MSNENAPHDEQNRPAVGGPVERMVRPQAWSPALTYQNYERQRVWANGEPRPEDAAYWKAQGLGVTLAYSADDVRYMLEGAWCAGYYHAGYTHDSAYAVKQAEKCAAEFLGCCADDGMPLDGSNPNPPECDPRA